MGKKVLIFFSPYTCNERGVQILLQDRGFISCKTGIAESYGSSTFNFLRNFHILSISLHTITFSPTVYKGSDFPTASSTLATTGQVGRLFSILKQPFLTLKECKLLSLPCRVAEDEMRYCREIAHFWHLIRTAKLGNRLPHKMEV